MIQVSFCSNLNTPSYDKYLVLLCLLFLFFRWTSKIIPEMNPSSEKMQKEFQTLIAGRADQVLPLCIAFFFAFLLLSKVIMF